MLFWLAFGSQAGIVCVVAVFALVGFDVSLHSQRETPAGLAAASRWLGVREKLNEDEVFATLPPIAVGFWRRHLAYGAALGVAPGAVRPIPMGAESDSRAWSSYGGRWRAVEIVYPQRLPLGWGMHPLLAAARGTVIGAISVFVLFLVAGPLTSRLSDIVFITPFLVPSAIAALGEGQVVTGLVTRHLRYVRSITPTVSHDL